MRLAPGTRLGPYEIIAALGSGGMGEVYRGRDLRLDRTIAIKVLSPNRFTDPLHRERFAREARVVAALGHPHICALYDFGSDGGIDYLVMEYLEGQTLAERLVVGPVPHPEMLRYANDIADALHHAHRHGLVHGDLKPANVIVTKSGAKLLDFGVARPIGHQAVIESPAATSAGATATDLTLDVALLGTVNYLAPEQLERQKADARSDIFAFGALVYEMATSRKVFDGESQGNVMAAILSPDRPRVLEHEPLRPLLLDRVVRKCLAKDPDERWQSAYDLQTALQWIDAASDETSRRPAANRRAELAWILASVVLIASAIGIGVGRQAARQSTGDAKPIRFSLDPPDDAAVVPGGAGMALSSDGRRVAVVATPRDGKPMLWIRSLDAVAARPLAGTTDASHPFWSADSRFVAFMADGKLKTIDIGSGNVRTLCDARGAAGTWNASDDILFKSDVTSRIERVSARDGRSMPVTSIDPSHGDFYVNWPQFLPDGRHFLYLVLSTRPEASGVYAGSLDGADRTRVLSDETQAQYVRPGYLVFHRNGTLVAQRFDASALTLQGEALPLVEDIAFNGSTRRGVFSVSDAGVLAYRSADDSALRWFDRNGAILGTTGPPGRYRDPAISPDGKTVAIARFDARVGTDDIFLIDIEHGTETRVTFDPGWDGAPTWSPDGARLAFAAGAEGKSDLYVKSVGAGTNGESLLSLPSGVTPLDWSHDGRFLLFRRPGVATRYDLFFLPIAAERKPIAVMDTEANESSGQLSPDGRWLAYDSNISGTFEVYVRPVFEPSSGAQRISNHGGIEPRWRRDGRELFYLSANQKLMAVSVLTGESFKAESPVVLFATDASNSPVNLRRRNQYDVTPDGQRFLINTPVSGSPKPITMVINWTAMLSR